MYNIRISNQGYLRSAFEFFDTDASGYISADEIREIFRENELDLDIFDQEIDAIIRECDRNGDGSIDYKEFLHLMTCKKG